MSDPLSIVGEIGTTRGFAVDVGCVGSIVLGFYRWTAVGDPVALALLVPFGALLAARMTVSFYQTYEQEATA